MPESLKQQLEAQIKIAMKARQKQRLAALRLMMAEFQRVEIDERIEIDEPRGLAILDKMTRQRNDSLSQFQAAGRDDLAEIEARELAIIREFLPAKIDEAELRQLITQALEAAGATSVRDMGSVMALLKPQVQGRADMGQVSQRVKNQLTAAT